MGRTLRETLAAVRREVEGFDSGANLDRMIEHADAKMANLTSVVPAGPDAQPRRPFTSGQPWREQSFARMTPRQIASLVPTMVPLMWRMQRSGRYYRRSFAPVSDTADPALFDELEALARRLGAVDVAYVTDIPDFEIFAGKAVPHRNAIVFTVEMDRDEIATAPHFRAFHEVAKGYRRLATVSNALTDLLRGHGHAAYPGTALGGLSDYVALAERAGLGAIGYHGLLISPDDGARLRINTIYTSITNLPVRENPHTWVRDFCAMCRNCVRSCPPGAIHDEPRDRPGGGRTCIEYTSCREYFSSNFGCAVCVKVCPFSEAGYDHVKAGFTAAAARRAARRRLPVVEVGSGVA